MMIFDVLSLNQIWVCVGITEFSFLTFLKILFFILFLLVNLGLLYSEYLDNINKDNSNYVLDPQKNGIGSELKKIGGLFLATASGYSARITIKNELVVNNKEEEFRKEILYLKNEVKRVGDVKSGDNYNFIQKMQFNGIERSFHNLDNIRKEKSDLMKVIEEKKVKFEKGDKSITQEMIRKDELKKIELESNENKGMVELNKAIEKV